MSGNVTHTTSPQGKRQGCETGDNEIMWACKVEQRTRGGEVLYEGCKAAEQG